MEELDDVEFLVSSRARARILRLLAEETTLSRDQLRERLDVDRTTVKRNLEKLVDRSWVESSYTTYTITPAGRLIAESVDAITTRIRAAERIAPIVEHAPADALDFDPTALADATVVTGEAGNPYKMINSHVATIRGATEMRALLPLTGLHPMEAVRDQVLENGMTAELVVAPRVERTFRSDPDFRELLESLSSVDQFGVFTTDADIPFYLGIFDDHVEIGVNDDGEPKVLVETAAAAVRDWAENEYARPRAAAAAFEL